MEGARRSAFAGKHGLLDQMPRRVIAVGDDLTASSRSLTTARSNRCDPTANSPRLTRAANSPRLTTGLRHVDGAGDVHPCTEKSNSLTFQWSLLHSSSLRVVLLDETLEMRLVMLQNSPQPSMGCGLHAFIYEYARDRAACVVASREAPMRSSSPTARASTRRRGYGLPGCAPARPRPLSPCRPPSYAR